MTVLPLADAQARPVMAAGSAVADALAALEAVTAGLRTRFGLGALAAHEVAAHLTGGMLLAPRFRRRRATRACPGWPPFALPDRRAGPPGSPRECFSWRLDGGRHVPGGQGRRYLAAAGAGQNPAAGELARGTKLCEKIALL
jgi:hypothetical protein